MILSCYIYMRSFNIDEFYNLRIKNENNFVRFLLFSERPCTTQKKTGTNLKF